MEIYIVLYSLIILVGIYTDDEIIKINQKKIISPNIFLFVFITILYLVSATRIGIGTDYNLYKGIYDNAAEKSLALGLGFEWISNVFRFFELDYQTFIAFNSFIFLGSIAFFSYKFSEYKYISLITLFGTYSYLSSFNGFRQFTSISLVLISLIIFFSYNKKITGIIFYIISLGLHKSSIMFLPLFFLNLIPLKRKLFLVVMFMCFFSYFMVPEFLKSWLFNEVLSFNQFFQEKYAGTEHVEGLERGITNQLFYIFYWAMTVWVILDKIKNKEKVNWMDKVFLLYFIVNSFLPYSNLVKRVSYLFELMALYMVPRFISSHKSKLLKNTLKGIIITVFTVRLIYVLFHNGDGVVPYESVISNLK